MAIELLFEEGVPQLIGRMEGIPERPLLVAVYGDPNSGKTYLIERLAGHFESRGVRVPNLGAPHPDTFQRWGKQPSTVPPVALFHCGWEREEVQRGGKTHVMSAERDPVILARTLAGLEVQLRIGMYNPHFGRKPVGNYDFIFRNSASVAKLPFKLPYYPIL